MIQLTEEKIRKMRKVRDDLISSYSARDKMLDRYEEIYFMSKGERPKGLKGTDEKDIKETISSSGRDAVTGLKRILDSGEVHINVEGAADNDKLERALKQMLRVSGEYRIASVEKDVNLSMSLHGPGVLTAEAVDDLIESQKTSPNEYVAMQLEKLKKKTPFIIQTISARQSYPMWGGFGLIGHARVYKLKGAEITDRWGVECKDPNETYEVKDFFYYENRLVEVEDISDPVMAEEWVTRGKDGKIIGSINIPVFTRYAGGSSLFAEPDKQSQPLLYAKAQGNWDKRENLYFTYLFTGIYQQGLPGPLMMIDPENADQDIEVEYRRGIRTIVAKGQIANTNVIDGDVVQVGNILQEQAASQTIQPQTLGQNTNGVTFSQFALASKSGLIPAVDPKESQEALYADIFTNILERIRDEQIENELIKPADVPQTVQIRVTIEPDLEQDDLRNAQIALQLKQAGLGSGEWIDTNILKIADSKAMWTQRKKEELMDAMVELMKAPEVMQKYLTRSLGQDKAQPTPESAASGSGAGPAGANGAGDAMPTDVSADPTQMPGMPNMPGMPGMSGQEALPKTDPMIPLNERQ